MFPATSSFDSLCHFSTRGERSQASQHPILYCLGEESEDVLSSTNASEEERKKYETVMEKYNFFKVQKNVTLDGVFAEQYIIEVYKLAKN